MIVADEESLDSHKARAFLLSRPDFEVRILDVPRVPESELDGLIRYRLRSLYPGNPRETAFDYRVESEGRCRQVVVFISRPATVEKYRSEARGMPLLLPYSLVQKAGREKKDCRIWFCQPDWAELSIFRAGLLVSSTVRSWEKGTSFDFPRAEEEVPQEARALPVLVVAPTADLLRIRAGTPRELKEVRFLAFKDLAATHRKVDGLFGERERHQSVFPAVVRIVGLSTIVSVLALLVLFKCVRQMEGANAILKRTHSLLEARSRDALALKKNVNDLSEQLSTITTRRPPDVYQLLSELARVLGNDVQVRGLEIKGDAFRIEAVGLKPLRLMEGFRDNPWFDTVRLSTVVPEGHSAKERFSLSGVYRVR